MTFPLCSRTPSALLLLTSFYVFMCYVCLNKRVYLTQTTAVARHCHEGSQGAADDTVWSAEGGLLERAGVLVQEGVHAVGGGGAAIPHERL